MSWHSATESIMRAATVVMGEPVTLISDGVQQTVRGIFEVRTNFDETDSLANIENFQAVVDFNAGTLLGVPKRKDRVFVPRTGTTYQVTYVESDGWARHRCYLKDPVA